MALKVYFLNFIFPSSSKCLKFVLEQFPLWLRRLRTQHSLHEDEALISGLPQWVKVQVPDVALIPCCCGIGLKLQLRISPQPGNFICCRCGCKKKKKKKRKKERKEKRKKKDLYLRTHISNQPYHSPCCCFASAANSVKMINKTLSLI